MKLKFKNIFFTTVTLRQLTDWYPTLHLHGTSWDILGHLSFTALSKVYYTVLPYCNTTLSKVYYTVLFTVL